jgi:hypothetical protein
VWRGRKGRNSEMRGEGESPRPPKADYRKKVSWIGIGRWRKHCLVRCCDALNGRWTDLATAQVMMDSLQEQEPPETRVRR